MMFKYIVETSADDVQAENRARWCWENVGKQDVNWKIAWVYSPKLAYAYKFKNEEDATMFKLKFG